ncbi:MAG: hypothetical protein IKS20_04295 [Victivallales bacterium]|nr:hypothetical protein [Victivallales bacterium]
MKKQPLQHGKIEIGCNYWASHAGMYMWRDWREDVVERDFAKLSELGITMLRVFPLWPDFQPVTQLRGCFGDAVGYGDASGQPLSPGDLGLDSTMLERFMAMADCASRHGIKLVVALLTGWMSGRLFAPPVLEGRNLISDAEALLWEGRFILGFVTALKGHPAIVAWEPGNECNCLGKATVAESAHWLDFIAAKIHSVDATRPIWTGMHGPNSQSNQPWNLFEQSAHYDALTTHPYPCFTEFCGKSPLNTPPAVFHSTAETLFYRGMPGNVKPAFVEEIGSLGPMVLSEERRCAYLRTALASAWVHDCLAFLWWCAFDQDRLPQAPYCWVAMERELGLLSADGIPKPAAMEIRRFKQRIAAELPCLPPRRVDALVILTPGQNQWQVAYGAFVLAKQAGLEVEFLSSEINCLPQKKAIYWLPAISGNSGPGRQFYGLLAKRVHEGASLLVSDSGDGNLQPFEDIFGIRVDYLAYAPEDLEFRIDGCREKFTLHKDFTRRLLPGKARILGKCSDGTPSMTCFDYGKGKVIFLNAAPELAVLDEKTPRLYRIYRQIAKVFGLNLVNKPPEIGRTIHDFPDGRQALVEINYSDRKIGSIPANDFKISLSAKLHH